jgi:hypothetical protein
MARLSPPGVRVTKLSSRWCAQRRWRSHEPRENQDMTEKTPKQLLHLVFGGELKVLDSTEFKDLEKLEIVGIYPNYATAYTAWKAKAQQTVDNAHMRYFVVHMHRLLDPEEDDEAGH